MAAPGRKVYRVWSYPYITDFASEILPCAEFFWRKTKFSKSYNHLAPCDIVPFRNQIQLEKNKIPRRPENPNECCSQSPKMEFQKCVHQRKLKRTTSKESKHRIYMSYSFIFITPFSIHFDQHIYYISDK